MVTDPYPCPLCGRPNYFPSDHHMVPKSKGGRTTLTMCADCYRNAHATFTNKELALEYNTVEALLAHPTFAKATAFLRKGLARQFGLRLDISTVVTSRSRSPELRKQDPSRRCRMVRTNDRKRKSRTKYA
jgi:hypothetical protein